MTLKHPLFLGKDILLRVLPVRGLAFGSQTAEGPGLVTKSGLGAERRRPRRLTASLRPLGEALSGVPMRKAGVDAGAPPTLSVAVGRME